MRTTRSNRKSTTAKASRNASAKGSKKRLTSNPAARRGDKAKDRAERKKIAGTFDVAAFEATNATTAAETAKDWSTPY